MKLDPWSYSERGTEHSEQVALFIYCNMAANYGLEVAGFPSAYNEKGWAASYAVKYTVRPCPVLKRLFAIHNQGHGDAVRGARASAEGVKSGVPDLCLPVKNKEYGGLYIELKRKSTNKKAKGVVSDNQKDWIKFLFEQNYQVVICYGWEEALDKILNYLNKV